MDLYSTPLELLPLEGLRLGDQLLPLAASKEQVEALVVKFHCIDPEAAATAAGGEGDNGTIEDAFPKATVGGKQG